LFRGNVSGGMVLWVSGDMAFDTVVNYTQNTDKPLAANASGCFLIWNNGSSAANISVSLRVDDTNSTSNGSNTLNNTNTTGANATGATNSG